MKTSICKSNYINYIQCTMANLGSAVAKAMDVYSKNLDCLLEELKILTAYRRILYEYVPFNCMPTYMYSLDINKADESETIDLTINNVSLGSYTGNGTAENVVQEFKRDINDNVTSPNYNADAHGSTLYIYSCDPTIGTTRYTYTTTSISDYGGYNYTIIIDGIDYSGTINSSTDPDTFAQILTNLGYGTWSATTGANNIFIIDSNDHVFGTLTFGIPTWAEASTGLDTFNIIDINFLDNNFGVVSGNLTGTGYIFKTTNGATTWTDITGTTSTTALTGNYFINSSTGWTCGALKIFKTTDGGGTWTLQITGSGSLNDIKFINANIGWAVGNGGTIYYTPNGGTNWIAQYVPSSVSGTALYEIFILNSTTAYIIGNSGVILKTTNSGGSWTLLTSGVATALNSIYFIDNNIGWAVGANGIILKTINGGNTWSVQTTGVTSTLTDVRFINEDIGFVTSSVAMLYTTTDGGNTWKEISISDYAQSSLSFINNELGFMGLTDGIVLKYSLVDSNNSTTTSTVGLISYNYEPTITSTGTSTGSATSLEDSEDTILNLWNCQTYSEICNILQHALSISNKYTKYNSSTSKCGTC